ncbi:hypothetical protein [Lysobacter sp. 22409]|uniref:hypothetical protein n=1 Tax=Lysobacter sp. 22409 TaxID=3453917 RepID=UPI003F86DE8F
MKTSGHRLAMCFVQLLLVACATVAGGPQSLDYSVGNRIEDFFTLPLIEGPSGFDRLADALQRRIPTPVPASAAERTFQQMPVALRDGYVVQRYLRLEEGGHLMAEFATAPCVPVRLAVSLARPEPTQLDHYRRTGIYLATGRGMSVTLSADAAKPECVRSVEIAETPGGNIVAARSSP